MSDIPPNIVGSSLQAGYVQGEAAKARDARRAGQTHAGQNSAKAIDDAGNTIETGDEDTQVFGDAQGTGGQGRTTEEEGQGTQSPEHESPTDSGVTTDDHGDQHVDLQA